MGHPHAEVVTLEGGLIFCRIDQKTFLNIFAAFLAALVRFSGALLFVRFRTLGGESTIFLERNALARILGSPANSCAKLPFTALIWGRAEKLHRTEKLHMLV